MHIRGVRTYTFWHEHRVVWMNSVTLEDLLPVLERLMGELVSVCSIKKKMRSTCSPLS